MLTGRGGEGSGPCDCPSAQMTKLSAQGPSAGSFDRKSVAPAPGSPPPSVCAPLARLPSTHTHALNQQNGAGSDAGPVPGGSELSKFQLLHLCT